MESINNDNMSITNTVIITIVTMLLLLLLLLTLMLTDTSLNCFFNSSTPITINCNVAFLRMLTTLNFSTLSRIYVKLLTANPLRQVVVVGFFDFIQSNEGGSIQLKRFYMEC